MLLRLIKEDTIRPANDPVIQAAEYADGAIARDVLAALGSIGDSIPPEALLAAVQHAKLIGSAKPVLDLIPHDEVSEQLRQALDRLVDVSKETAQYAFDSLEAAASKEITIAFDQLAPQFTQLMLDERTNLIQGMTSDMQATVQQVIVDGYQRGTGIDEIARNVRELITLGEKRAQAVLNYRRLLENGQISEALSRELHDSRYTGTKLTQDKIDRMVARYAERQLASRAQTIARTEALRAAARGHRAGYQQMIDRGLIDKTGVTRKWLVAHDEITCPVCMSIPAMNPKGVGMGQPFESIDGPVMDSPVHPSCRCAVTYHIAATSISKGYDPNEARDDHGRWTDGGGDNEEGNPRIVTTKEAQEKLLRETWAQHGKDLDYEDVWETRSGDALWNREIKAWNQTHGTDINPDTMDMGLRGPNGDFLRHFESKYLEGKKAPFPGVDGANEFFEHNAEWHHTAYLPGKVPNEAPR